MIYHEQIITTELHNYMYIFFLLSVMKMNSFNINLCFESIKPVLSCTVHNVIKIWQVSPYHLSAYVRTLEPTKHGEDNRRSAEKDFYDLISTRQQLSFVNNWQYIMTRAFNNFEVKRCTWIYPFEKIGCCIIISNSSFC